MKKMTRKTLAKKINDGNAEIESMTSSGNHAFISTFNSKGQRKREQVELTGKWPEGWGGEEG